MKQGRLTWFGGKSVHRDFGKRDEKVVTGLVRDVFVTSSVVCRVQMNPTS